MRRRAAIVQTVDGAEGPPAPQAAPSALNSRVRPRSACRESKRDGMIKVAWIPVAGTQCRISAGDYCATVTELGAGLRVFRYRDQPVIAEYEADELPPGASGQLLAPWPNRIDGGKYAFDGASYQLGLSEPARGNAIHGLTRWAGWQPAAQAADPVQLRHVLYGRPGFPFCLDLTPETRLSASGGLRVSVTASNAGSRPAPYGTRSHPSLTARTPLAHACELELPAALRHPADERGIPQGPPAGSTGTT